MQQLLSTIFVLLMSMLVFVQSALSRSPIDFIQESDPDQQSMTSVRDPFTEIVDPYVEWPLAYGVQQTGNVSSTFDSYGTIGRGQALWQYVVDEWPRAAFMSPPESNREYLYLAGLWVGGIVGTDTLVSHGFEGWVQPGSEFRPVDYPAGSVTKFNYTTDYSMRAVFTDTNTYNVTPDYFGRPHTPLNIRVSNRSHVWRTPEDEDIIIYDLVVTNIGDQHIDDAYIGLYTDTDVGFYDWSSKYWLDDIVGSIPEQGIGYAIDNDGDPIGMVYDTLTSARKIFALKLLGSSHPIADTNFNWWRSSGLVVQDFGPRLNGTAEDPFFDFQSGGLGTPVGDRSKYYMLSHREWDYDQVYTATIPPDDPTWMYPPQDIAEDITDGGEIKFLLSWGPFDLEPDSSTRLLMATFTADDIHDFSLNLLNLPEHPYGYIANLNFGDLLANSARADELAANLLDPLMPVPGLHSACEKRDSIVIAWDPWVLDNIDGYEVYISEIPTDQLPYPGVPVPWLRPSSLEPAASLGQVQRYKCPNLHPDKLYFVNVAHRGPAGVGSEGVPLMVSGRGLAPGPAPESEYSYFYDSIPAEFNWQAPPDTNVDHYRIYRFDDLDATRYIYRPFYTEYRPEPLILPIDSFDIDGTMYYYCAMEPYATVGADVNSFEDQNPVDGACYVLTAVDSLGFETDFSRPIQSNKVYAPTRDILVISNMPYIRLTPIDTVISFYDSVLSGYDYDIYSVFDTVQLYGCDHEHEDCIDWRDFTRFKMTIVDIDSYDNVFTVRSEERFNRLKKHILSGNKVAYFGCLYGMNSLYGDSAVYCEQESNLVRPYLGIDSMYYYFYNFYYWSGLPLSVDSCFGFTRAEPANDNFPDLPFDAERQTFAEHIKYRWYDDTPPSVAAFKPTGDAEIIYRYRSRYPESSRLEGWPVGVMTLTDEIETYMFGFHLWYMEHEPARQLIDILFAGLPEEPEPEEPPPPTLPASFTLRQNYPNPFNPYTVISFDLPHNADVTLEIYNVLGQRVKLLVGGDHVTAGTHQVEWNGDNDDGQEVSSGIYFYRLTAGDRIDAKKMMLIK